MKMGTTRSPCPYDAAARHSVQSASLRRPAILRYDSWAAVFPISEGGPVTASIAALSINLRIDDDVPFGDIALRLAARSLPTADR